MPQSIGQLFGQALLNLLVWTPSHGVVLVGIVIAVVQLSKRRKPAALALVGLLFFALSALFSIVYVFVPLLIERSGAALRGEVYTTVYRTLNVFHSLINAAGLSFLLWAVFSDRGAADEYGAAG